MRPSARRGGFTLVELLIVVTLVAILAAVAVPRYTGWVQRARATQIIGEFRAIRFALHDYQVATHRWPPSAPAGVVPPGLEAYLEGGVDFEADGHEWALLNMSVPGYGNVVALMLTLEDGGVGDALGALIGDGTVHTAFAGTHVFFIDVPGALLQLI